MPYQTKREMAGILVGQEGRYMPDAPTMPYFVRLGSRSFHSHDTADLADKVAAALSHRELVALMEMKR